jgi:hypothetical protein
MSQGEGPEAEETAVRPLNPFSCSTSKPNLKWAIYEALASLFPQGATVNQLVGNDGPLRRVYPTLNRNHRTATTSVSGAFPLGCGVH